MSHQNSLFTITSKSDIELLTKVYDGVSGEMEVKPENDDIAIFGIPWCLNPFQTLSARLDLPPYPFDVQVKMCGPDTIRAVSVVVSPKLDPVSFEHPNKSLIMTWAAHIDTMIKSEMERKDHVNRTFKPPTPALASMSDLMLAIRLSKFATHVIPHQAGFIVTNPKSAYLSWVGLTPDAHCTTSLTFDKDDGFSTMTSTDYEEINYLNSRFQLWKDKEYQGKMADYYEQY
jgi:hypothetical protein